MDAPLLFLTKHISLMIWKLLGLLFFGWATAITAINGQYMALVYLIPLIFILKSTLKLKQWIRTTK